MAWSANTGFYLVCRSTSSATIAITKHKMTLHVWPVWAELSPLTGIGHEIYWKILSFIAVGLLTYWRQHQKGLKCLSWYVSIATELAVSLRKHFLRGGGVIWLLAEHGVNSVALTAESLLPWNVYPWETNKWAAKKTGKIQKIISASKNTCRNWLEWNYFFVLLDN